MGRSSDYSQEVVEAICRRLIEGESLRTICKDDEMPATSTVCLWLTQHAEFAEQYARAREAQADALADEILDIANTPQIGIIRKIKEDGVEITEEDMLGHRRLQVDARKWLASKLQPKKYGEKLDTTLKGPGEDGAHKVEVSWSE